MEDKILKIIAEETGIRLWQAKAAADLIDSGCTVPFIARYRKEATGAMDDEALRTFDERLRYLRNLEDRKQTIIAAIEEQGKLTDELRSKIEDVMTAAKLEDLYRPYKPKRKTRADIAREKGLQGLADYLMTAKDPSDPLGEAEKYISEEKEVPSAETAIAMAQDIIAGDLSDNADLREWIRKKTFAKGMLTCTLGAEGKKLKEEGGRSVYENYYEFSEAVSKVPGHRVLAINRGEKEKILSASVEAPEAEIAEYLGRKVLRKVCAGCRPYAEEAAADAYKRLIAPSIANEVRSSLSEDAEAGAIKVFGSNLEQLLMQPPLREKTVLGWDPAFRTGCKLAVCDPTGKILATDVIYPTAPQNKVAESEKVLERLCDRYSVDVISIGNGTASRESERIAADFIRRYVKNRRGRKLSYVIVNEAGASVYSASKLASEEYPDLNVGERSSASIARRLQDPLSELVKIDPKAIGVGQYQHDMNQKRLGEALAAVVEKCVNMVGVDLNTASPSLLSYVSGISRQIAGNIVAYRDENGRFDTRKELLKVPKLGPKAFEQCAGFLRITGGSEVLDATAVHPESYDAARAILKECGYEADDIISGRVRGLADRTELAEKLGIGKYTFADIASELEKPGRDPREEAQAPILRDDVLEISDLAPGMELKGTVRNIVDFGAFVDIGVHQDGLVHISEMADRFVKHPLDVVRVGDIVDVRVLSIDEKRGKIALSMRGFPKQKGN